MIRRTASCVHRLAVALLFSQTFVLSVLVLGWVYRLMQRTAVTAWWRRAGRPTGLDPVAGWPRWLRSESGETRRLGGLRENARRGFAGLLTTWAVTLPACGLWLVAWQLGWDNSFHKGYEHHASGAILGWIGILLFVLAMLYVPLAQARHAVTGEWQAFFDVRVIARIVPRRWPSMVGLALLYSAVSVPLTALRVAPAFFAMNASGSAPPSRVQVVLGLDLYYLVVGGALLVPAYLALRLLAARIYASAIADGVRSGRLPVSWLSPFERDELGRLRLLDVFPEPVPASAVRSLRRVGATALSTVSIGLLTVIWFSVAVQVFVLEFFHFQPGWGWLNQPLIHVPWIRILPGG